MGILKIQKMKSMVGLTLIELLMVIVIVGVLAAIAVPMYSGYMVRARRADAKIALEQLRAAQEMYRAEKGGYALQIANTLDKLGAVVKSGDYNITMVATLTTYTGTATAFTSRQSEDTAVPLTINQDGVKTPSKKWLK